MVGQEVRIYDVLIGITNEPCITLPSSLHTLNTLGYFNFVLLLFLYKTIPLRTDSSRRGPFLFFFDYFKSIQERITYCTSFERLYFSLPTDVNNNIVIYIFKKISLKNIIFLFYFFNTNI